MRQNQEKLIANNRHARHDYELIKTFEAGLVLTGTEVCSLRENNCQLTDSFVLIRNGEAWIHNLYIASYSHGDLDNVDSLRRRKLLLHKKQLRELERYVTQKGMAIVPLKLYFNKQALVKVQIALARGKKLYDKRQTMAKRDSQREIARALKRRSR